MTLELKSKFEIEMTCSWFAIASSTLVSPISAVYQLELRIAMEFYQKYHCLQMIIPISACYYLELRNVINIQ